MNHLDSSRIAGAATPSDPQAENSMGRNLGLSEGYVNNCSCTLLDERLDDLIAIADLTGATLDAVVATVGRLPEATFTATIDVLPTLPAPPAPSDPQEVLHEHRAATNQIAKAETDAGIAEIDAQINAIERQIMSTPARTPAEAYLKLMAIFPEICVDLQEPTLAPLKSEIEHVVSVSKQFGLLKTWEGVHND